ncbi:MAG: restriction endonuclease subunit S [Acutalibacteraceae bacterium]
MAEWIECSIGDLCSTISDTYKGNDEYVVLVNTSDVLEGKVLNHETVANKNLKGQFKKTFKRDDILYSEIRPANKRFAYIDFENTSNYIASTKLMVLRHNEKVLPEYLFALLKSNYVIAELQHLAETRSGTFPQITFSSELAPMKVFLPDKDTQKRIVSILSSIEQKIDKNTEINNNLEQQAQAIFANEFLSLDTLPEGWKQASLIDIADYLNGLAMQKYRPTADESGIPVLKIKELRQGCCDDNSELCSPSIKSDYIIHDGDVIFSWSGSLLVDLWCGGICGLNQHLFKVTSSKYDKWFYYAWTKHHLDRFVAVAADKATTMGHIKRDELAKAEVLIPNEADYNRIGALLQPIYEMIISNRIENKKLAATRDTLLPKLMNGEIDMSEVDYE